MLGPPSFSDDRITAALKTRDLPLDRQVFLLRVESTAFVPMDMRKSIIEAFIIGQAAIEADLGLAEMPGDKNQDPAAFVRFVELHEELRALVHTADLLP